MSKVSRGVAVVVAAEGVNFRALKQLLSSFGWGTVGPIATSEAMLYMARNPQVSLIFIDESASLSGRPFLRHLMADMVGITTPVIYRITQLNERAMPLLRQIGIPIVFSEPLTPNVLGRWLNRALQIWNSHPYALLAKLRLPFIAGKIEAVANAMTKLEASAPGNRAMAMGMAIMGRMTGDIATSEAAILRSLRVAKRDPGVMLALSDFYLRCGMIDRSYRLLSGLNRAFPTEPIFAADLSQILLLRNQYEEAEGLNRQLLTNRYLPGFFSESLARILLVQGRIAEARAMLAGDRSFNARVERDWNFDELRPDTTEKAS